MKFKGIFIIAAISVFCLFGYANNASAKSYLIEYSWGATSSPAAVAKNIDFIESLPFDGVLIRSRTGRHLMNPDFTVEERVATKGIYSYEKCLAGLAPLNKTTFKKLNHNFALVNVRAHGMFEDWSWILENFKNFAKACKEVGLRGIVIDNEQKGFWNYQSSPQYFIGHTLKESHMQARLRGKEVMQAIVSEFPEAHVIVLHGPYTSATANKQRGISCSDYALLGAFAAGVIEGSGPKSIACDGGELYDFRDEKEFRSSYQWRKFGITDPSVVPPVQFMDDKLRSVWSKNISIAYGVYASERPDVTKGGWKPITDMKIVRNTVATALKVADDYVWHYTERFDWFNNPKAPQILETPGYLKPAPQEWVEAIRLAKQDVESGK